MIKFLMTYQKDIIYVLSGICAMIAFLTCITGYPSRTRKESQLIMTFSAMFLLMFENFADFYSGQATDRAHIMVRICNFIVFISILMVIQAFDLYIIDVFRVDLRTPVPILLKIVFVFLCIGEFLVVISQFTGLYYTFDDNNVYHRSDSYAVSYIFPLLSAALLLAVIIRYRKYMWRGKWITLMLFAVAPLIASIVQYFMYGIYVTEMTLVGMVVVLYVFVLIETGRELDEARQNEVRVIMDDKERVRKLFSQTAVALVNVIDERDRLSKGHSVRVADYSRRIAALCGRSEEECEDIYYAALLHDVGKIGIAGYPANRGTGFTEEEYEIIKLHPSIGGRILSNITDYPFISAGARFHHERYDGTGYPDGLAGEDIPEIGRIVAVADAYDNMTSHAGGERIMPQSRIRQELTKGSGTKFDPRFTAAMIELINRDTEYIMREP